MTLSEIAKQKYLEQQAAQAEATQLADLERQQDEYRKAQDTAWSIAELLEARICCSTNSGSPRGSSR